jgi:uncharacterized ferritin-like protein (DUF455 family)
MTTMNVHAAAKTVLAEPSVEAKLDATARLWADWQAGHLTTGPFDDAAPLIEAGRPDRPVLALPKDMPARKLNGLEGHAALIHALVHIEFTAINLALDAVYRFQMMPLDFHADWLRIAAEEADHFGLLRDHLSILNHDYGDFPAHGGLWENALDTRHDPLARMAVIPRYFEARGLDVTPGIQSKLRAYGDQAGGDILDIILRDEIGHVAAGDRWFRYLCKKRGLEPEAEYREQIDAAGLPRPRKPFNQEARVRAGFSPQEMADL